VDTSILGELPHSAAAGACWRPAIPYRRTRFLAATGMKHGLGRGRGCAPKGHPQVRKKAGWGAGGWGGAAGRTGALTPAGPGRGLMARVFAGVRVPAFRVRDDHPRLLRLSICFIFLFCFLLQTTVIG